MSEPAQGPASCRHLSSPRPSPCLCSLLSLPLCSLPCSAGPSLCCATPSLPVLPVGSPSLAPMRRAQSSLCLRDETLAGGQRRKLSSRFPVARSSESFSPGDTPRQRFRQRRPGPLGAPSSHGKGEGQEPCPQYPLTPSGRGASLLSSVSPHEPCPPLPWSPWPSGCLVPPQDPAWDGMAPSRPWRNTKQMPTERVSGGLGGSGAPGRPHSSFTHLTTGLYQVPGRVRAGDTGGHILVWEADSKQYA